MGYIGQEMLYKVAGLILMAAGCWKISDMASWGAAGGISLSAYDISVRDNKPNSVTQTRWWVEVEEDDYIYSDHLGAAPIVVESHKLIFFYVPKVSCTVWKQLFRRMMGYQDWKTMFPHNTRTNGLLYLNQVNRSYATEIMNSPEWTRAMIVRDPKERFLSAYLDKVLHDNSSYVIGACCKTKQDCLEQAQTFSGFFQLTESCRDTHWRPQSERMEPKYLPLLNFVGHMESLETDAENLLRKINAWEEYGASGWGKDDNERIYQSSSTVHHATSTSDKESRKRLAKYYTRDLERAVEARYALDYEISRFDLERRSIDFDLVDYENKNSDGQRFLRP